MSSYLTQHTDPKPQTEPLSGQVENSAGGFAWQVDCWTRLRRFLVLGTEGGSYYARERDLTSESLKALHECIAEDGRRTVDEITAISSAGRAPKNDPAVLALAVCAAADDTATRTAALEALPEVCRIGTHIFQFASFVEAFRGWGPALRKALGRWYGDRDLEQLAYQTIKYRQRGGWTHRDLLRLAHPTAEDAERNRLYGWITTGATDGTVRGASEENLPRFVIGYALAQHATSPKDAARYIRDFHLPREAVNPDHLASPEVWDALLEDMPMTAMIRNLATMTRIGLVAPNSEGTARVLEQLADGERLRKARVHPISVLAATLTYASGRSERGRAEWSPVSQVIDALNAAFYESFGYVESTGKRYLLALDVSGSMSGGEISGVPGLSPRRAAAAMALVTAHSESAYEAVAFQTSLTPIPLSPRQRLDDVGNMRWDGGGTDCAQPMLYAIAQQREVDVFIVYTDSETWAGAIHPAEALAAYRRQFGIPARLIVCGMVSNGFSIADPNDPGMLDVIGFDTATPQLMAEFASARI